MIDCKRSIAVALASAALTTLAGSELALAAAAGQDTEPLEEVIVTAQNRVENVQKVPIAITVVGAEQIAEAGFSSMNDMAKIAPAVQITNDNSSVRVAVRGVGSQSNDETNDTSVVVNVDGEYINRPNVLGTSLFDLERVEVLRGPQGTLYGRNSTGGAVNFITRKPGDKFGVNASASYGNYGAIALDAGVDIPLATMGGIRIAGIYNDHDGYFSSPATPFAPAARSLSERNSAGRASLALKPTDAFSVNLAVEHSKRNFVNATYGTADLNAPGNGPTGPGCNAPGFVQLAAVGYTNTLCLPQNTNFLAGIDRRGALPQPIFGVGGYSQDSTAFRTRLAYEFSPAATLTYVGGYRTSSGPIGHQGLPVIYQSFSFQDDTKTQSHELRLNGDVGGVTYQTGVFYFKETLDREVGFAIPIPVFGPDGTFLSYFGRHVDTTSKSAFGQVEIPMIDMLKAVVGVRYTNNDRTGVFKNGSPFGPMGPNFALFGAGVGRKNIDAIGASVDYLADQESKTTWLAGLNYTPNNRTLIYGKVSTGFKGGGFDSVSAYKPETNTAFEVGLKKNFGVGGQNYLNLSAFRYDYKDLQNSVLLDIAIGGQVFNAGKATIQGLEAEGGFKLTADDVLTASVNYVKATYDEFLGQYNVYCIPGTGPLACGINGVGDLDLTTPGIQQPNFAGNTLPFTPKVVIALGYDHTFRMANGGRVKAGLFSRYKSSFYTDFFNYHDSQQQAITQTDVNLEYKPPGDHYGVQLFVRNLEDERPLTNAGFVSAGPDDIYNFQFGQPRTYGVRLSLNW